MSAKLWNRNTRGALGFECGVLPGALVLAVLTGLAVTGYAASSDGRPEVLLEDRISIFDPFILSRTLVTLDRVSVSDSVGTMDVKRLAADSVRISSRPELRSPFRPPLTSSGPPVGAPGRPGWAPPGSPQR